MVQTAIPIDQERIAAFCRKWKIREFSLFGSILRDDFGPDSDVDVLVEFESRDAYGFDDWFDMIEELKAMFGRQVDLLEKGRIRNPFRKKRIMESYQVVHG